MAEVYFVVGFLALILVGVLLIIWEGRSSLARALKISKEEADELVALDDGETDLSKSLVRNAELIAKRKQKS